jgi:hypothetical protein
VSREPHPTPRTTSRTQERDTVPTADIAVAGIAVADIGLPRPSAKAAGP